MSWKLSSCIVLAKPEPSSQSMNSIDCTLIIITTRNFCFISEKPAQFWLQSTGKHYFFSNTILSDSWSFYSFFRHLLFLFSHFKSQDKLNTYVEVKRRAKKWGKVCVSLIRNFLLGEPWSHCVRHFHHTTYFLWVCVDH